MISQQPNHSKHKSGNLINDRLPRIWQQNYTRPSKWLNPIVAMEPTPICTRYGESLLPLSTESFERKCKSVKLPNCCDSCIVSETIWSRHRQSCISAVFGSKTETLHRTNMVLSLDKQYAIGFVMTNDHSQSQCQDEIVATYLGIWRNDYDTII